ncbi:MAG TPA: helix-turn-helix domain-containing protein [Solirubrobacterales bacterium]
MPKRKRNQRRRAVDQGFVKSLAHELRAEILVILAGQVASPKELAEMLDEGLSQISYHVNVLKDYGRIALVKTEPRRGAVEHYYRATSRTLLPAKAWRGVEKGLLAVIGGGLASDLFDDLADAVDHNKLTEADSHISRSLLALDAEGRENVRAKAQQFTKEVEKEQRASVARAAKANGSAAGVKGYSVGVLAFEDSRDRSDKPQSRKVAKSASAKGKGSAKGKSKSGSKRKAEAGAK